MKTHIGPLYVRRSILIDAHPATVWQEFATLERIRAWFGTGHELHEFELSLGADVRLSVDLEGDRHYFGGRIVCLENAQELTFESQWEGAGAWPVPTFFTIRLTPVYGGTLVEIIHHGFERLGASAAETLEGYEEGWTVHHLKLLRSIIRTKQSAT